MIAILAVVAFLLWIVLAFRSLPVSISLFNWRKAISDEPMEQVVLLAAFGLVAAVITYFAFDDKGSVAALIANFSANMTTEFISIVITVLVLDRLYAKHSAQQEKERIIRQMASLSNHCFRPEAGIV